jgi:hypothetical protein
LSPRRTPPPITTAVGCLGKPSPSSPRQYPSRRMVPDRARFTRLSGTTCEWTCFPIQFSKSQARAFRVTSPRSCGERSSSEAQRSRAVRGSIRAHSPRRKPLIPTFSPRKSGEKEKRHEAAFPRRVWRPSCCANHPRKNRGRRECRVRVAPMASCAKVESTRVRNHRYAAINRHSLRDGFNGYFVLSPVTGLFCHRRSRIAPRP